MDFHHNTSFRFILEDDSISSTSKARIRFCLGNEGKAMVGCYAIYLFVYITHFTFTSALYFHFGLISPWHLVFSCVNLDMG